jgi:SAM-dependent methyltransferase
MALAALKDVVPLLVCPRCTTSLVEEAAGYRCADATCRYGAPASFPMVDRWPVVVDFERSVLTRQEVDARAARTAGVRQELHTSRTDRLPRSLRRIWRPLNRAARDNVERLLALLPRPRGRVLVVGGGTLGNGLEPLYAAGDDVEVIGLDLYGSDLTHVVADAHAIPLASGSVDAVVVQAVLEHVLDPARVVAEIHRVLAEDGLVYAETPFLQQVHAGRYDFTRFTASGHRYLFRRFTEIAAGTAAGPGTVLLWTVDHLVRGLTRSQLAGRLTRGLLFWLHHLDRWVPQPYANDSASAVFFLGRRSSAELSAAEVVAYYPGAQRG